MNNLISVIVPVYNIEQYLPECVKSLLGQTYKNIEIILVDDGSKDGSGKLCDEYAAADTRVKVIHKENGGLSAARNDGIAVAGGEYLMFVDGDDWIDAETCEVALSQISESDADIAIWSYMREYREKSLPRYIFDRDLIFKHEEYKDLFTRVIGPTGKELAHPEKNDSLSAVWGKLYRFKKVAENISFVDTKEVGNEDLLYNVQAFANAKSAIYVNRPFYHYRKSNDSSFTHCCKKNLLDTRKRLFDRIRHFIYDLEDEHLNAALENRIALDIIGQGLNVNKNDCSFSKKIGLLKAVLQDSVYKEPIKKLDTSLMPIHWKVYFGMAKKNCAVAVLLLNKMIKFIKTKI